MDLKLLFLVTMVSVIDIINSNATNKLQSSLIQNSFTKLLTNIVKVNKERMDTIKKLTKLQDINYIIQYRDTLKNPGENGNTSRIIDKNNVNVNSGKKYLSESPDIMAMIIFEPSFEEDTPDIINNEDRQHPRKATGRSNAN